MSEIETSRRVGRGPRKTRKPSTSVLRAGVIHPNLAITVEQSSVLSRLTRLVWKSLKCVQEYDDRRGNRAPGTDGEGGLPVDCRREQSAESPLPKRGSQRACTKEIGGFSGTYCPLNPLEPPCWLARSGITLSLFLPSSAGRVREEEKRSKRGERIAEVKARQLVSQLLPPFQQPSLANKETGGVPNGGLRGRRWMEGAGRR